VPLDLACDLAHALDAAAFAEDRQSGKSTSVSILALHTALYTPDALVLVISPSQRQSKELFAKVTLFLRGLQPAEILEEDNRLSCTLANRSRIVSLPGDEKTIRGYSGPALIVEDEASRVIDATHAAIRPMLAVSRGRLVLMSTPAGKLGHFYEIWHEGGPDWERIGLPATQCPRISAEFLEAEKKVMGPLLFDQEYFCKFHDSAMNVFSMDLVERAISNDFELLFSA
jgi:hypothetical protein